MKNGALAQSVEHLTFNQVVRGSNPRCFIGMEMRNALKNQGFWHLSFLSKTVNLVTYWLPKS